MRSSARICQRLLIVVALFLSLPAPAIAAPKKKPPPSDALSLAQEQSIKIKYRWFRLRLFRAGKELSIGFFGQNYRTVFAGVPAALAQARRYYTLRAVGAALWAVGLTASVTGLILRLTEHPALVDRTRSGLARWRPLAWGVITVGAAIGATGAVLFQVSQGYLTDAVNLYNKDVYRRARRRFTVGLSPGPGGALLLLAGQF